MYLENLGKLHAEQLYLMLVGVLDEEVMGRLEQIGNEAERENQLKSVYEQKTRQSLESVSDELLTKIIRDFVQNYQEAKKSV